MAVSVFDLFKIGIGPSSSHTVGPMRAARLFALRLAHDGLLSATARVHSQLYGSLGATGKGHGSDKAVLLGLAGHEPDRVDPEAIPHLLDAMRQSRRLVLLGQQVIGFDEAADLVFHRRETLPFHANGMRFTAFDAAGTELASKTYYSVGGGFVVSEEVAADGSKQKAIAPDTTVLPHPFHSGAELLGTGESLARALVKIEAYAKQVPMDVPQAQATAYIVNPLTGRKLEFANLFTTHPPTAERVARLRHQF
jgi:L-serine dehydratase